jgi:hypothetical protein
MAADQAPTQDSGRRKSVVVVKFPDSREFIWLSSDSPLASAQVGQVVELRDQQWRILRREEHSGPLMLTLGIA